MVQSVLPRAVKMRTKKGENHHKYLEMCPPSTTEAAVKKLVKDAGGDATRIQEAISSLWDDVRAGHEPEDWATVKTKRTKRKVHIYIIHKI